MLWIILWITREKKGITPAFAFPHPSCRFSGHSMPFFGKTGTGDIVSYFHKKIKTLGKCKPLENAPFAIFAIQKGYPHDPQSLVSQPVENENPVPPASYALRAKVMLELSTKKAELSTCKSGERGEALPPNLHQGNDSPEPLSRRICMDIISCGLRLSRREKKKMDCFWPKKAGKIPRGKVRFP